MQSLLNVPAEVVLANINAAVAKAAVKDIGGKVLAIFFPILAFVVSGFEHCVANMYYIPAGFFTMINFCRLLLKYHWRCCYGWWCVLLSAWEGSGIMEI